MIIGFLCIVIPCRHNITLLLSRICTVKKESNWYHYSLTIILISLSFVISILVPGILAVLKFLGAASTIFSYLIPCLFEVYTLGLQKSLFYVFQTTIMVGVATTSVVVNLIIV